MFRKKESKKVIEEKKELIDRFYAWDLKSNVTKLFPLNNGYIAAAISYDAFSFTQGAPAYSVQIYDNVPRIGLLTATRSYGSGTVYKPYVMSDGSFFHAIDEKNRTKNDCVSANLRHVSEDLNELILEALDPSIAANTSTSNYSLDLVCAAESRDKLYIYNMPMREMFTNYYGISSRIHTSPSWHKQQAEVAFTAVNGEKINSIAACIIGENVYLAMALDNGILQLSQIVDNQLVDTVCLDGNAEKNADKLRLFATSKGLLLAYEPDQQKLRIWDIKNNCQLSEHKCPKLFNVNAASSGDYFTGLESQDGPKSDQLYLLDLASFKPQSVKLDKPVEHFVLGYNNYMCSSYDTTVQYTGHITRLLPEPPAPAPVQISQPSSTGLFSRLLSALHLDNQSKDEKSEIKSLRR